MAKRRAGGGLAAAAAAAALPKGGAGVQSHGGGDGDDLVENLSRLAARTADVGPQESVPRVRVRVRAHGPSDWLAGRPAGWPLEISFARISLDDHHASRMGGRRAAGWGGVGSARRGAASRTRRRRRRRVRLSVPLVEKYHNPTRSRIVHVRARLIRAKRTKKKQACTKHPQNLAGALSPFPRWHVAAAIIYPKHRARFPAPSPLQSQRRNQHASYHILAVRVLHHHRIVDPERAAGPSSNAVGGKLRVSVALPWPSSNPP
jgi:hypothetical protein